MLPKRYLVTGATSGIGAATMSLLHGMTGTCIAMDRRPPEHPGDYVACNLADEESIARACAAIEGPLDGIAHVAGVPGTLPGPVVMTVNYLGARRLIEELLPKLAVGASVVMVSSLAARRCSLEAEQLRKLLALTHWQAVIEATRAAEIDGGTAYETSKRLLNAWLPYATELGAKRRIRVNIVSPGPVTTPLLKDFRESMGAERIDAAEQVVGRHGRAEEIAAVIAFLLSPAASWVNGVEISADGGLQALREAATA